jgi:hypothetical protein
LPWGRYDAEDEIVRVDLASSQHGEWDGCQAKDVLIMVVEAREGEGDSEKAIATGILPKRRISNACIRIGIILFWLFSLLSGKRNGEGGIGEKERVRGKMVSWMKWILLVATV